MSFDAQLLSLMPSTIKVSTRTTHSFSGTPSFASSTTSYRARIVSKPGYIRGPEQEEIEYRTVAWARSTGATSITASDRVTLPDGSRPPVVGVERYADQDGQHHVKIYFGQ